MLPDARQFTDKYNGWGLLRPSAPSGALTELIFLSISLSNFSLEPMIEAG